MFIKYSLLTLILQVTFQFVTSQQGQCPFFLSKPFGTNEQCFKVCRSDKDCNLWPNLLQNNNQICCWNGCGPNQWNGGTSCYSSRPGGFDWDYCRPNPCNGHCEKCVSYSTGPRCERIGNCGFVPLIRNWIQERDPCRPNPCSRCERCIEWNRNCNWFGCEKYKCIYAGGPRCFDHFDKKWNFGGNGNNRNDHKWNMGGKSHKGH